MNLIIVPGIGNSGEQHWQTLWEQGNARALRIRPSSWDRPDLEDWLSAIDEAVAAQVGAGLGADSVIVAHSLGCIATAEWLARNPGVVAGAVLVAPPDDDAAAFPAEAPSFRGVARAAVPGPALVIASEDDPYCRVERAESLAERWNARLEVIGALGHINVASGLGSWPEGRTRFAEFSAVVRGARVPAAEGAVDPAR